jgi:hypothetical protein
MASQPAPTITNALAIVSLVLGILSLPLTVCYGLGIVFGIAALILGLIARRQISKSEGLQGGKRLALAGLILGNVAIAIFIVSLVGLLLMGPTVGDVFSNTIQQLGTPTPR